MAANNGSITITVPNLNPEIKWGGDEGLHEKITTILINGVGGTEFNNLSDEQITTLKAEIRPAAAAYKSAINKTKVFDDAVTTAEDVNGTADNKLTTLIAAIKTFKTTAPTATATGATGGSKRGGSKKRRGKSKRGGSKRRGSKRRKY